MPPGPLVAMAAPEFPFPGHRGGKIPAGLFMYDCDMVRGRGARKRIDQITVGGAVRRTSLSMPRSANVLMM